MEQVPIEDDHLSENMSSPAAEDGEFSMVKDHEETDDADVIITIKFPPERFQGRFSLAGDATLEHMLLHAAEKWPEYDWSLSKAIIEKRVAGFRSLLKSPDDDALDLTPLNNNTVRFMAPKFSTQRDLQEARQAALRRQAARSNGPATRLRRSNQPPRESTNHTFHTIRALPYLPNPQRSEQFLQRLKNDPGIRAAMRRHKFSVGLLTEMDPGQYTESNHEGTTRILGLNRNQGEVIELRLRTDAYDGYRDYKTIRNTLCHELAHNVHGPHDRNFWDLCHQIEREVHEADWLKSGRTAGGEEYRPAPEDEEEHMDEGGWVGGEYTLGGESGNTAGLSRREVIARAAEARMRKMEAKRARSSNAEQGRGEGFGGPPERQ